MRWPSALLLLAVLLTAHSLVAETLRPTADGIEIEAGSLGKFTLEYPQLLDAGHKATHKLLGETPAGKSATLTYEGGAQIEVAIGEGGKVLYKISKAPADVKL